MYFTTERLLRYRPLDALVIMYNQHNASNLVPNTTQVVQVKAVRGTLTELTIKAIPPKPSMDVEYHKGAHTFYYDRLDLGAVLGGLNVQILLPTTTHDIALQIQRQTGIVFDLNEIVFDVVKSENFVIKARPNSLRWVGGADVVIVPPACPPITELVRINVLRDLVYPRVAHLSDLVTNNILSDLEFPLVGHLSELVKQYVLDDLVYTDPNHLSNLIRNYILDDLIYPNSPTLQELVKINVLDDLEYKGDKEQLITLVTRRVLDDLALPSSFNLADLVKTNVLSDIHYPTGDSFK